MPAGRPSAELRPCLRLRAGYDATDDKGHYHLNVYCEDVDDEAYHADPAVDQWWGDSEACDCSCYSGEADSNDYYNGYYNYYNGYEYEYDSAAYMCVDDFKNFDPRCDWSCAHAGPYCYDGGSDNHGCNEWSNDEAGPCCVSGTPTVTPAPSPMPMPNYEAVYDQGCNSFIHMDHGYYGASEYINGGSTSLEQCAAAVWAYDGIDGCMGDYFYYEWGGYCNCPTDSCQEGSDTGAAGGSGQLFQFTTASSAPSLTPAPTVDCPHAKMASGKCVFLTENRHSFYGCEHACGDNAALVCMDSYEANAEIYDFVSSIQADNVWIGYMTQSGSWSDGSGPISVQSPATCTTTPQWGWGQPDNDGSCNRCATMDSSRYGGGEWHTADCFDEHHRCVCEYGESPETLLNISSSEFEDHRETCDDQWAGWEPLYNDANACCYNLYGQGCEDEEFWECGAHGFTQFAYNGQYARRRLSSKADAEEEAGGEHRQLGECDPYSWCQCMSSYLESGDNECSDHYSMDYYQDYYSFSYSYLQNFYANSDKGCDDYMGLNGWNVPGYGTVDDATSLSDCAKAVKAYDGTNGCMGDNFYYTWTGECAFERVPPLPPPRAPRFATRPRGLIVVSLRARGQATARGMGARSLMKTRPGALMIPACCSRSTPRRCQRSFRPRSRCPAFSALPVRAPVRARYIMPSNLSRASLSRRHGGGGGRAPGRNRRDARRCRGGRHRRHDVRRLAAQAVGVEPRAAPPPG